MKNKITVLITILISFLTFTNTYAQTTEREMALASALTYIPTFCTSRQIKNNKCSLGNVPSVVQFFNSYVNVHNYGSSTELDGWTLVDYTEESTSNINSKLDRLFSGYTFKKGNDVIIVYRGTDFVDIFEWIQHLTYGLTNVHAQETHAEKYILKQAAKYKDDNIYITGHSLGGYLADVGAATLLKAIENAKSGNTTWDWKGFNLYEKKNGTKVYDINDFNISDYKNINFVKSLSLNGMGFLFDVNPDNIENSVQSEKIKIVSANKSKVIEYSINGDVVSSLGLRVGEIREMDAPLDSVSFHRNNYGLIKNGARDSINSKIDDSVLLSYFKKEASDITSANANAITLFTSLFENKALNLLNKYTRNDLKEKYDYYNLGTLIGYVHLTHETDGFICLLNDTAIENAQLKVYPYKNIVLSHEDYIKKTNNNIIAFSKKGNQTVRAMTTNACARSYEWYKCDDQNGKNCVKVQENNLNSSNKSNQYNVNVSSNLEYYKVKSIINDNYKEAEIKKEGNNYKYQVSNTEKIVNNITKEKVFGVVYDVTAPKCTASIEKFKLKKGCKKTVTITCTDNSGIQNEIITTNNISKSGLLDLRDNVNIKVNDVERENNLKNVSFTITLEGKKVTAFYNGLKVNVSDIAGNSTSIEIKANIDTNLFSKKCD